MAAAPRHRAAGFLLLPYGLIVATLLVVPIAGLLVVSFREHSSVVITGTGFTFANYARLGGGFYLNILWQTVRLSLIATLIATILAYPLAYVLARSTGAARTTLTCLIMVPLMTSIVVKTFGWYILLGDGGFVAGLLGHFGVRVRSLLGNDAAVLVGLAEFSLPFMAFSLAASIERVPVALEEAASNLGATRAAIFLKVVVPMSWVGLVSGLLLCFGAASSAYVVPAIMGGTATRMVAQQIYDDVLVAFNWPGASALSIVLLAVLGVVLGTSLLIGRREVR